MKRLDLAVICLWVFLIFCLCQFYACTKTTVLELIVWQPVTQTWNPTEQRWEVTLEGGIVEKNGGSATIERIWCEWSWEYQIGGGYSGLIAETTGGQLRGHDNLSFHLEGYIEDERELQVIVFADTYDNEGRYLQLLVDTVSEHIYP